MPEFKIQDAAAVIPNKGIQILATASVPRGPKAEPTQVVEAQMVLEIDAGDCLQGIEFLFPDAKTYAQAVAGLEHAKGEDRTSRTKLPELELSVAYKGDQVFNQTNVTVKSKAQFKVDESGEAKLILRPRVKLDQRELWALSELMAADVRVFVRTLQMDLSDFTNDPIKLPTRIRKNETDQAQASA